jgi:hypothetical protein
MSTNQVVWQLGGEENNFNIYDVSGVSLLQFQNKGKQSIFPWWQQHKFQYLGDNIVSLFDNNNKVTVEAREAGARCIVLVINEQTMEAFELFSYSIGDTSIIYGGTDVLPSGRILASSIVDWVYPTIEDAQYHTNIWEIDPTTLTPSWRVGFRGVNPASPEDTTSPYPHYIRASDNADSTVPTGWNIYTVDRVYSSPIVADVCTVLSNDGLKLMFTPYNTIKTQADAVGMATLSLSDKIISVKEFLFQKGWLRRPQSVDFPSGFDLSWTSQVKLTVSNEWGQERIVNLSSVLPCKK